jgi:hypothetical protein
MLRCNKTPQAAFALVPRESFINRLSKIVTMPEAPPASRFPFPINALPYEAGEMAPAR